MAPAAIGCFSCPTTTSAACRRTSCWNCAGGRDLLQACAVRPTYGGGSMDCGRRGRRAMLSPACGNGLIGMLPAGSSPPWPGAVAECGSTRTSHRSAASIAGRYRCATYPAADLSARAAVQRAVINCDPLRAVLAAGAGLRQWRARGRPAGPTTPRSGRAIPYRFDRAAIGCGVRSPDQRLLQERAARPQRDQGCVRRPCRRTGSRACAIGTAPAKLFLPERGVTCNTVRKVCYDNGVADFSQTRRYFGDRAADALD